MSRLRSVAPVVVTAGVAVALWVTNAASVPFISSGSSGNTPPVGPILRKLRRNGRRKPGSGDPSAGLGVFGTIGYVVLGILVLALLAFVVSATWSNRRGPREQLVEAPDDVAAFDAFDVPAALVTSSEQQLSALRSGSPRNAIVACWWELERTCADTGLPRAAAETSTEFTARVLGRYVLQPHAVAALAALYREARFAAHVLTEAARDRAVTALEEIVAGLRGHSMGTAPMAATP